MHADESRWAAELRRVVPPELRRAVQQELRDQDVFPQQFDPSAAGPSGRALYAAVVELLKSMDDTLRRECVAWFGNSPGLVSDDALLTGHYVAKGVLREGFYDVREVLEEDAQRVGKALDSVKGLRAAIDEDCLVPLSFFDEITMFHLRRGEHFLQFHPLLRRRYCAGVNTEFTSLLKAAHADPRLSVRVAVDPARVSSTPLQPFVERDHWWGRRLSLESLDDPHALGCTVHGRPPGLEQIWTFPLERTEFWWSGDAKQGLKWLQVEELRPLELPPYAFPHSRGMRIPLEPRLNRYLHSARDTRRRCFDHLDGAVRVYDEREGYERRLAAKFDDAGKAQRYRKLFRVDGPMSDKLWSDLTMLFFRENEMVAEYVSEGFQTEAAEKYRWPADVVARLPRRRG